MGYQSCGAITSSYSTSSIISTANSSAINGGLVGWQNSGSITSSYSTGNITATSNSSTAYAGGLVGSQSYGAGPITSCYSTGNVVAICNGPSIYGSGVDVFAGGLVAACYGSVVNCYSTGQVSATGNHFVYKGGLLGYKHRNSHRVLLGYQYFRPEHQRRRDGRNDGRNENAFDIYLGGLGFYQ